MTEFLFVWIMLMGLLILSVLFLIRAAQRGEK